MADRAREVQAMCAAFATATASKELSNRKAESMAAACVTRLEELSPNTRLELVCLRHLVVGLQRRPLPTSSLLRELKKRRQRLAAQLDLEARKNAEEGATRLETVFQGLVGDPECSAVLGRFFADKQRSAPVDALGGGLAKVAVQDSKPGNCGNRVK